MGGGSASISPVVGGLIFVAVVVAIILVQKAMAAATAKATQGVMRGTHKRGQAAARAPVTFTVPRPAGEVLDQVVTTVNAYPAPPALVGGLYLKSRVADAVVFGFGSKLADSFVFRVAVTGTEPGSTRGTAKVLTWTETNGLVDAVEHIEKLQGRIAAAVTELGGRVVDSPGAPVV
ncbi:hypothetical protein [Actinotalea subterranea]|uniref:hypothetical protein n=1 Tax=Actinotalea subterranea TaxID=2607497 RepID=UPI0011EEAFA2|nr:hypothetical protein [Actinotalea subterranea]